MSEARVHSLSNGVRVVADPMAGLQSAALSVVVRGGARWEDEATSGWSHLLEHMVFKGAGGRTARGLVEAIENEGGQVNAATGYERTSFQVRCLKGGLPLAMEVLSDLVRRPTLAEADLAQEKGVIGQEIAEAADQPDDRVFDLAQAQAFADQPLGRPILGSDASLQPSTTATLRDFHRRLYAPNRIVVAAAGAVDEDEVLKLAEAAFGDAAPVGGEPTPQPARFVGGTKAETRRLEQAHLVLLLQAVGARDPDDYALRLFAEILGGGMASRLFQSVREEMGLAYNIDAYADAYEDVGVLGVYAGTAAANAARAIKLVLAEVERLAAAPDAGELARAKAQLKAHLFMGRESPLARAEHAAAQLHLHGRITAPEAIGRRIDAIGLEDLRRVGARVLGAGRPVLSVVGPRRAAAAIEAVERLAQAA